MLSRLAMKVRKTVVRSIFIIASVCFLVACGGSTGMNASDSTSGNNESNSSGSNTASTSGSETDNNSGTNTNTSDNNQTDTGLTGGETDTSTDSATSEGSNTPGTTTAGSGGTDGSVAGEQGTSGAADSGGDNNGDMSLMDKPNILIVITDDQGIDASAQYSLSSDLPNTPVVNQLAASGITFDNMWATPSCTTTRAALLSGYHGINNGVVSTPGVLSPQVNALPTALKNA